MNFKAITLGVSVGLAATAVFAARTEAWPVMTAGYGLRAPQPEWRTALKPERMDRELGRLHSEWRLAANPELKRHAEKRLIRGWLQALRELAELDRMHLRQGLADFSVVLGMLETGRTSVVVALGPDPYRIPDSWLAQGKRGTLGALLDLLQAASYQVLPRAGGLFPRPGTTRRFPAAV